MTTIKNTWNKLPMPAKAIIILAGSYGLIKGAKNLFNRPDKGKLPQGGAGLPVVSYTPEGKPVFWEEEPEDAS